MGIFSMSEKVYKIKHPKGGFAGHFNSIHFSNLKNIHSLKSKIIYIINDIFPPTRTEVEITTNTGQRYKADSIIVNDDNTVTAHRVYPLVNFGNRFHVNQTTINNNIYAINQHPTTSTTAFTDYLPAGFIEELQFHTYTTNFGALPVPHLPLVFPTLNTSSGAPIYYSTSARSKREQLQAKIRNQMQPDLTKLFGHRPRAANKRLSLL